MKLSKRAATIRRVLGFSVAAALGFLNYFTAQAYNTYSDGCVDCHGNFLSSTSPKGTVFPSSQNHEMHRASGSMATGCNLCHSGSSRTPVYIWKSNGTTSTAGNGYGCSGCHVGAGLRAHHVNNGVTVCLDCHPPETPDPENVNPPYYSGTWTTMTKVRNPGNTVKAANTNENWSIGDFIGLDNDGNNLYDLADYAVGPREVILSSTREGNNQRVSWQTVGGRTNILQAAASPAGPFTNISSYIAPTNIGLVTTNSLQFGGATNKWRYYRVMSLVP